MTGFRIIIRKMQAEVLREILEFQKPWVNILFALTVMIYMKKRLLKIYT